MKSPRQFYRDVRNGDCGCKERRQALARAARQTFNPMAEALRQRMERRNERTT